MGETYDETLARQMGISDCDIVVDSNGELQKSDDGPDNIGDPPQEKTKVEPPTSGETIHYVEF